MNAKLRKALKAARKEYAEKVATILAEVCVAEVVMNANDELAAAPGYRQDFKVAGRIPKNYAHMVMNNAIDDAAMYAAEDEMGEIGSFMEKAIVKAVRPRVQVSGTTINRFKD